MTARRQLVVGAEAEAGLRRVGPWAWAVLQALALRAEEDGAGGLVARVSARRLAVELGAARATVDRAVDVLSAAGWVSPCSWREAAGGRFVSQHQLCLPAGVARADLAERDVVAPADTHAVPEPRTPRRHRSDSPRSSTAVQLSLLDLDPAAD